MYLLMYLLDIDNFWIFQFVLILIIYKICKLMCSIFLETTIHVITRNNGFSLIDQVLLPFQGYNEFS